MAGGDPSWLRALRHRLGQGREYCRECGEVSPLLSPGHMLPRARGGKYTLRNLTILCPSCQRAQGANVWFWQVSLYVEGYRPRNGGLRLPSYPGVPDLIVKAPPKPSRRKTPRPNPDALHDVGCPCSACAKRRRAHIPPMPGCICSSCTMWRSERLFDLDGHNAADRRGAL